MSSVGDNSSTPAPENDNFIGDLMNVVQEALGPNIDITDLPNITGLPPPAGKQFISEEDLNLFVYQWCIASGYMVQKRSTS